MGPETLETQGDAHNTTHDDSTTTSTSSEATAGRTSPQVGDSVPDIDGKLGCYAMQKDKCH